MNLEQLVQGQVQGLPVYRPGKPISEVAREYGLAPSRIDKLASNENPLGPPPGALRALQQVATDLALYPDNTGYDLVSALSRINEWPFEGIVLGAGSNEIFYLLCQLFGGAGSEVVLGEYGFISYRIAARLSGAAVVSTAMPDLRHDLDALLDAVTPRTRLVFLPNPNNPTGTRIPVAEVDAFARALPDHVIFCYDEAYAEYDDERLDADALIRAGVPLVLTRTFSKIYGLAGLRIGYALTHPEIADYLNRIRPPFNTGIAAQAAALAALEDAQWVETSRQVNEAGRTLLLNGCRDLGLPAFAEGGNFVLVEVDSADNVTDALQRSGTIVRPLSGYGLPNHIRVTVGLEAQNTRFLESLAGCIR
jgi:histidinol-phosphate aminotransferase